MTATRSGAAQDPDCYRDVTATRSGTGFSLCCHHWVGLDLAVSEAKWVQTTNIINSHVGSWDNLRENRSEIPTVQTSEASSTRVWTLSTSMLGGDFRE